MDLTKRVHALDAVRGVMMLLGLVIHASVTYASTDYGTAWPLKDPDNSMAFDLLVTLIHTFRMPLFFITAGYFSALLFFKKGPNAMIIHRVRRILFPFLVSLFILYPLVIMAFTYSIAAFDGNPSPFRHMLASFSWRTIFPFSVIHLWFLYFLILYCFVGWLLGLTFCRTSPFTSTFIKLCKAILHNIWLRYIFLTVLLFICLNWMGTLSIKTNNSWKIDLSVFSSYFIFFGLGWMVYRTNILNRLKEWPFMQLGLALGMFMVLEVIVWPHAAWMFNVRQLCVAIYTSLFVFGCISLFLTYFNYNSSKFTYVLEASYWVYIIHLPIVVFIPGLLAGLPLPLFFKFVITLSVTSLICFVTYHWFVRNRFIGSFLNGNMKKANSPSNKKILLKA